MKRLLPGLFAALVALSFNINVLADPLARADAAVADILFGFDGSEQYTTYRVNEDGSVDLVFARNTPDALYEAILDKLQHHPDISSVLAGKGGPVCSLF